jgi:SPP1 family predicted phage head-tail adaptor
MQAGRLRKRLDLETPNTVADTFGETPLEPWTLVTTLWGSVEPISGRERLMAEQVQGEITHRIKVRYVAAYLPTPVMRFTYADRHFQILSVANRDERNRELEIMCKELV